MESLAAEVVPMATFMASVGAARDHGVGLSYSGVLAYGLPFESGGGGVRLSGNDNR